MACALCSRTMSLTSSPFSCVSFYPSFFFHTQTADIVFIVRDGNTGETLPTGFVEFSDVDVATNVIDEFNGMALPSGQTLEVTYARPRKPRTDNRSNDRRGDKRGSHYTNRGYNSQRNYD
jgi:RNA recognition motif-containing protein